MSDAKNPFQRARRHRARARIGIAGPSGSGKSLTSLLIAKGLCGPDGMLRPDGGRRVALIDSEPGASEWYASDFEFDNMAPEDNNPEAWVHFMNEAGRLGYTVLILDSLSALWTGAGGLLEIVDTEKKKATNKFGLSPWAKATPIQNRLIEAIRRSPCHIIATMRVKTDWVMDTIDGKQKPKKVGLAYVQRDQIEYEFDVVFDIDIDHRITVSNRRGFMNLDGYEAERPGPELGEVIRSYLEGGGEEDRPAPPVAPPAPAPTEAPTATQGRPKASAKGKPDATFQSEGQDRHVAEILGLCEDYGLEMPPNDGDVPVVVLSLDTIMGAKILSPEELEKNEAPSYEINVAALPESQRLSLLKYLQADVHAAMIGNIHELTIDLYDVDFTKHDGITYPEEVWRALNATTRPMGVKAQPRKIDPRKLDELRARRLMNVLKSLAAEAKMKANAPASPLIDPGF